MVTLLFEMTADGEVVAEYADSGFLRETLGRDILRKGSRSRAALIAAVC
jgi:hypothetical protein